MSKNIVIIGGGIIGVCCAYYLQKQGHQVTIIEKSDSKEGASYVNAGIITPSHIISLAAPGMINKGLKWMLSSKSPLAITPRMDLDFFEWSWLFKKASTHQKVQESIPIIKNINQFSKALYEDLKSSGDFDFHYQEKGLLMYYKTEKSGEEEWKVGQMAIQQGLHVEHLNPKEVRTIEPDVDLDIKGAVYYHSDAHMTPAAFMQQMKDYLLKNNVSIRTNEEVIRFTKTSNKVSEIQTTKQTIQADEIVLASGSWTQKLAKQLQIKIPVQAGKGYRINTEEKTGITIPAILTEAKVAVTPMDGYTRFAGTMEIGGLNNKINKKRVATIANASESYYRNLKIDPKAIDNASCGLRPCSPDGLPYIGKLSNFTNVSVATGHAMMGWSLGPATGKLIAEILTEQKTSLPVLPFHPERYN